jgi:hypothetical protein
MRRPRQTTLLWIAQGLLAPLFLFAGTTKFVLPPAVLEGPLPLPLSFIYFVGAAEIMGGLGLVLPGLLHTRTWLTPMAAVGLLTIMAGATTITIEAGMLVPSLIPLSVGGLAAFIAHGRSGALPAATVPARLPAIPAR